MDLLQAIQSFNADKVRELLDSGFPHDTFDDHGRSFLHVAVDMPNDGKAASRIQSCYKSDIIYMLIDAGIDLEIKDKDHNTCLWYAVRNNDLKSCDILLQNGADMHSVCMTGNSILNEVFSVKSYKDDKEESLHEDLQQVFEQYYPGLCKAVELRDICQVRRLTNLWCRTDLNKNGKTLKELALDVGHEEIISLIYGIHDTMKLIYHMLAKNTKAVENMLENSRKTIQLDLRKMSERGAPILYYLIQWRDSAMIRLFVKHGCHVYTVMRDEFGNDMPVLFSALQQAVPVDVIEALLPLNKPQQEEMLYKLLYQGSSVLEVALKNKVSLDVFNVIIDRGGPLLVADRNQFNESVRDIAIASKQLEYANVIDENVSLWIAQPEKYPGRRQALALCGWDHITGIPISNEILYSDGSDASQFLALIDSYQNQIRDLVLATESGNIEEFNRLREFSCKNNLFENLLCWDGRLKGDGLPLLHRAVLFNHPSLVKAILNYKPDCQSIDTLFDQYHRTALHYAYACPSNSKVKKMLLDNGCSEHVLDRNNKEPLDFKDKQGTASMMMLLERIKSKCYDTSEPDPWTNSCPTGHHECHVSKQQCYCKSHNYSLLEGEEEESNCSETKQENCDMLDYDYVENDTESEGEENRHWSCIIV